MIDKKLLKRSIILFTIIFIFHSWSLMRFPQAFEDEAWLTSRAWAFLQTGRVFGPLDEGVFNRFEGYWTFFPWFPTWIQALSLKIFGSPDLLPVRIVSLFFGMILLIAVYLICYSLGEYNLAIISLILVALSKTFIISAHLARPDIIAAALGYLAIGLTLRDTFSHWRIGLISGLLIGIAFEIHPHSIIFAPTIFLIFLFWEKELAKKYSYFTGFIAGGLLGVVIYLLIHVFPYPNTFIELNKLAFASTHTPPIFTLNLGNIFYSIKDTGLFLFSVYNLSALLILFSIYIMADSKKKSEETIIFLAV
ncbi:glycosyltransferase family 39 protein, partial [bacterium]|nr:glycosyltransferase family 39 protein [bacterium]